MIVVVVTTVVMVPMTDGNHDLGVCGLRKRGSENEGQQAIGKDFHIRVDGPFCPWVGGSVHNINRQSQLLI